MFSPFIEIYIFFLLIKLLDLKKKLFLLDMFEMRFTRHFVGLSKLIS